MSGHRTTEATKRAYRAAWSDFSTWCGENGLAAMPAAPTTVGLYLAARAGQRKTATLQLGLSAIAQAHRIAGHHLYTRHPAIRDTWAGIKRAHGTAQTTKAPTLTADIKAMVAKLPDTLIGKRDRALLLIGFAGAFRRSELVGIEVSDLAFGKGGVTVTLRRSKTDQEGQGAKLGIPYGKRLETCPVRALQEWIEAADLTDARVFRSVSKAGDIGDSLSDKAVALIVKKHAEAVGLDPARYAGHSLRAGLATSVAASAVSERVAVAIGIVVGASTARLSAQETPLEESLAGEQAVGEEGQTAQAQPSPPAAMGDERGPMASGHMHMEMMRLSPKERCLDLVAHAAGLVAYIEVRLDLTPEQRPLWDKLKEAAQAGIEKQRQVCESVGAEDHPPTVLDREARVEQFLAARLALLQSTRPALEALYKALSPEQRALLDRPWPHGRF